MEINVKLGKNFTTQFNKMCEKYGEDFEKLNDEDIVALNYDNGMGYSFDYWEQSDKVKEMN